MRFWDIYFFFSLTQVRRSIEYRMYIVQTYDSYHRIHQTTRPRGIFIQARSASRFQPVFKKKLNSHQNWFSIGRNGVRHANRDTQTPVNGVYVQTSEFVQ